MITKRLTTYERVLAVVYAASLTTLYFTIFVWGQP